MRKPIVEWGYSASECSFSPSAGRGANMEIFSSPSHLPIVVPSRYSKEDFMFAKRKTKDFAIPAA